MVAAALEEPNYPLDELVVDLANIRAGERFGELPVAGGERLAAAARGAFGTLDVPGVLDRGLVPGYGEGASAILDAGVGALLACGGASGDFQRMRIEWQSLLRQIVHAPDPGVPRWSELAAASAARLDCARRPLAVGEPLVDAATLNRETRHALRRGDFR